MRWFALTLDAAEIAYKDGYKTYELMTATTDDRSINQKVRVARDKVKVS